MATIVLSYPVTDLIPSYYPDHVIRDVRWTFPPGMSYHSQSFDGTTARSTIGDIVPGEYYTCSLSVYTSQTEFNYRFRFTDTGIITDVMSGSFGLVAGMGDLSAIAGAIAAPGSFGLTASVGTLAVTTP